MSGVGDCDDLHVLLTGMSARAPRGLRCIHFVNELWRRGSHYQGVLAKKLQNTLKTHKTRKNVGWCAVKTAHSRYNQQRRLVQVLISTPTTPTILGTCSK